MSYESKLKAGEYVLITCKNLKGRVAYVGLTNFAPGNWAGIILNEPKGKNNGTVLGQTYFKCASNYGIFVRPTQLRIVEMSERSMPKRRERPSKTVRRQLVTATLSVEEEDEENASVSSDVPRTRTTTPTTTPTPTHSMMTINKINNIKKEKLNLNATSTNTPDINEQAKSAEQKQMSGNTAKSEEFSILELQNVLSANKPDSTIFTAASTAVSAITTYTTSSSLNNDATPKASIATVQTSSTNPTSSTLTSAVLVETVPLPTAPPRSSTTISMNVTKSTVGASTATRSTSSTQLRPTRISQPKPTSANGGQLALAVPFALAPKRSKTSVSPTASFSCLKRASFIETGFLEILQPQFTPGHPLRTPVAATPTSSSSQLPTEIQGYPAELHQLREEVELLRIQRAEDKRKLHELEKLKIQNEQHVEFKTKIMSQHGLLQRELQRCRQEMRDVHDMSAKCKRELDEVGESIELLTLDKEMAEERAETLQLELEILQERNEELKLDLEILRAENEGKHDDRGGGDGEGKRQLDNSNFLASGEIIRLEQYNQRLRETVVRLRDALAQEKQALQKTNKELETKYSEISELKKIKVLLTQRVDTMEVQIMELKDQVDAALGAEHMVTSLADIKLELEERVKLLEEEVSELEALEEIHEQLIESNQELENDLREEIERLSGNVKNLEKQREAAREGLYDRDITIMKFRELVRQLNEQLQLKDTPYMLSIDDFSSNNSQLEETSQSNDFQHVFMSTKAYGRAIEQQLKAVELKLQSQHIEYILAFVPEEFLLRGGEHDVLLVLLLLQRINEKLEIISNGVDEKFPAACEFGRDAIFEGYSVQRYGFRAKCCFLLKSLMLLLQQMLHGLDHCDYEVCQHAAIYRSDLEAQELHVDEFVRLLRSGLLDEHTPCEPLERVLYYMQGLYQNLLTPQALVELVDEQKLYHTLLEVYEAGLDCVNTNAGLLHTIIQLGDEQTDSFQCMQQLTESTCHIKQRLKKLQRRLAINKAAWTGMQCARYQRIQETNEALCCLINLLASTAKEACKNSTAISHDKLWRLLTLNYTKYCPNATSSSSSSNCSGSSDDEACPTAASYSRHCLQLLEEQIDGLSVLLDSLECANVNTVCMRHATRNTLLQRAAHVKRHYESVKQLQSTIGEREKEIKSLKYAAKCKQHDYSELQIRKEMADKQLTKLSTEQMQALTQLAAGVEVLEQSLLAKEVLISSAINSLCEKLNTLEASQLSCQQHLCATSANTTTSTVASNRELQMLHSALRQERCLRIDLQHEVLQQRLHDLAPIQVPQRLSPEMAQNLKDIDSDLAALKRKWLLAQITLNDDGTTSRESIEHASIILLRRICEVYFNLNPHRAAPTYFGMFASDDFRSAILKN